MSGPKYGYKTGKKIQSTSLCVDKKKLNKRMEELGITHLYKHSAYNPKKQNKVDEDIS